jgi:hypothetical protein
LLKLRSCPQTFILFGLLNGNIIQTRLWKSRIDVPYVPSLKTLKNRKDLCSNNIVSPRKHDIKLFTYIFPHFWPIRMVVGDDVGRKKSSALLIFAWWKKTELSTQTLIAIIMCLKHLCLWVFASIVSISFGYYTISESPGTSALAVSHLLCMSVTELTILQTHWHIPSFQQPNLGSQTSTIS